MIEAAKMAQVDYTIQIMYNSRLKPTHVWAGDIIDAHHAGVRVAAKTYCTPTYKDADQNMRNNYKTGTIFCHKWEDVIAKLRQLHPGDPRVAVYPYAGMQHQEIELDG